MSGETSEKQSQLVAVLREGVSVVQMIVFKEIRAGLAAKYLDKDTPYVSMLAGAITNELFGSRNPEEKFAHFRKENWAVIEQELLSLAKEHSQLRTPLTDALRIQALCDNQEGGDSSATLTRADELGILVTDRDIPLPSSFMTFIRTLGEQHNLIIPPVQISPEEDKQIVH